MEHPFFKTAPMQHEEPCKSPGNADSGELDQPSWTLANLAFAALMAVALAIMIAGILLGPQTGLVHPEL
jgi:hypothetical protein